MKYILMLLLVSLFIKVAVASTNNIATVNGIAISKQSFEQALQQFKKQGQKDSKQLRALVRDELIAKELFFQAAEKSGIEKDPKVSNAIEQSRRNILIENYLQQAVKPKPVAESQIQELYEKIKSNLGSKEYKVDLIKIGSQTEAEILIAQIKQGANFQKLARQSSLAPSAKRGGTLGWLSFKTPIKVGQTGGLPMPVAQFLEKTNQNGVISNPIAWEKHFYIVKVEQVRTTKVPSYQEARGMIKNMLAAQALEQAMKEFVGDLIKKSKITQ